MDSVAIGRAVWWFIGAVFAVSGAAIAWGPGAALFVLGCCMMAFAIARDTDR